MKFRFADEDRQHGAGARHHIIGGDQGGLAVVGALAMVAQRLGQRVAQALFMGAALGRGDGIAIGADERINLRRPGHGPFHRAARRVFLGGGAAGEIAIVDGVRLAQLALEEVEQTVGEFQRLIGGRLIRDQRRIAAPADFHAAKQIGLALGHAIEPGGGKFDIAENLGIGLEADNGAAPVDRAQILQLADGMAALKAHHVRPLVARHIHFHPFRQGIDHGRAHAMQPAGSLIGLAVEFAAGMQRGHDDFQRRLVLEFGMRIDGNAAAIVADHQHVALFQFHLDAAGMAGHCFVHGIVEDFRSQVMQRGDVGAADIHAGAAAHRLKPFQHFDVLGGIGLGRRGRGAVEQIGGLFCHGPVCRRIAAGPAELSQAPVPARDFLVGAQAAIFRKLTPAQHMAPVKRDFLPLLVKCFQHFLKGPGPRISAGTQQGQRTLSVYLG